MNPASTRIWTFGAVILMIAVVALGWFLGASPQLADASRFDAERANVRLQNDLARAAITQLEIDFEQIDELREQIDEMRAQFPAGAEYDDLIEEFLLGMVAQGLTLNTIAINEPAPTSTVFSETAPASDGAEPGSALPAGSLLRVSASVTVTGPLSSVLAYIDALQLSSRFSLVPTVDFSNGSTPGAEQATFTLIMFVVTSDAVESTDGSIEGETTPTPTPSPSVEPTVEPTPGSTLEPTPTPTPTQG